MVPFEDTVQEICDFCFENNLQSVIIEGGQKTLQSFIDTGLWDEARVFETKIELQQGVSAPILKGFSKTSTILIDSDCLHFYQHLTK